MDSKVSYALDYEWFLLSAFKLNSRVEVGRSGYPAGLADADKWSDGNIDDIKVAVGYACAIYSRHLIKHFHAKFGDADYRFTENLSSIVLKATNLDELENVIKDTIDLKKKFIK